MPKSNSKYGLIRKSSCRHDLEFYLFVKTLKLCNKNKCVNADCSMRKGDIMINVHFTKDLNAHSETSKTSLHHSIQMSETG